MVRGYVSDISIRKVLDQEVARFDVELSLLSEDRQGANKTVLRFTDARNVHYGDPRDGIDPGVRPSLTIEDVSGEGRDGIAFKAHDSDGRFSLHCRRFDVEEVAAVSLPEHCTVLF